MWSSPKRDAAGTRRKRPRDGGAMDAECSPLETKLEQVSEAVHTTPHGDGTARKSLGHEELPKLDPGSLVPDRRTDTLSGGEEPEGVVPHTVEARRRDGGQGG